MHNKLQFESESHSRWRQNKKKKIRKNQQGIALLEVLIAFLLIGFGGLSLVKLQLFIEQKSDFVEQSRKALDLAEAKLEWFTTRGAINAKNKQIMVDFERDIVSGRDSSDSIYTLNWSVVSMGNTLKKIEIESSWNDRHGIKHSVKLQTMLSVYSEFNL